MVRSFLEERGIDATVIRLDGAVETSVQLGVADVIADVVETGTTLRQAGLETFGEPILRVRGRPGPRSGSVAARLEVFQRRLQGVLRGPQLRDDGLRQPQRERRRRRARSPPASRARRSRPLHREGWVAVRAMVPRDGAHRLMDELCDIGARGILVTDIHACRL